MSDRDQTVQNRQTFTVDPRKMEQIFDSHRAVGTSSEQILKEVENKLGGKASYVTRVFFLIAALPGIRRIAGVLARPPSLKNHRDWGWKRAAGAYSFN